MNLILPPGFKARDNRRCNVYPEAKAPGDNGAPRSARIVRPITIHNVFPHIPAEGAPLVGYQVQFDDEDKPHPIMIGKDFVEILS